MTSHEQRASMEIGSLKAKMLEVSDTAGVSIDQVEAKTVTFKSSGGEQSIAQGTNPIGQQINNYGISYEDYKELAGRLKVTEFALSNFFKILEDEQVPLSDLDSKLREIAAQHKELLLLRLETVQSEDLQVIKLKEEAWQAIKADDYAKAEDFLRRGGFLHHLLEYYLFKRRENKAKLAPKESPEPPLQSQSPPEESAKKEEQKTETPKQ